MNNCIIINNQRIDLTEEQVSKLLASAGSRNTRLSEIPVADTFKIGDNEFIVLDQYGDATAVILKKTLPEETTFGENNNYDGSTPDEMCNSFAEALAVEIGEDSFIEHRVDLTSDDGLKDYGSVDRKMSLMTTEEYRRYVEILDKHKLDAWWWLATPRSTATHNDESWVKCVSPSGLIFGNLYDIVVSGVRPFCILKSNIFVSK